jgi:hypothetical protein
MDEDIFHLYSLTSNRTSHIHYLHIRALNITLSSSCVWKQVTANIALFYSTSAFNFTIINILKNQSSKNMFQRNTIFYQMHILQPRHILQVQLNTPFFYCNHQDCLRYLVYVHQLNPLINAPKLDLNFGFSSIKVHLDLFLVFAAN